MTGQRLEVTILDVGWGDCILIEARDGNDKATFGLVDCNDTTNYQSSRIYVKRYFERLRLSPIPFPAFESIFTTHAHADHINGIQSILSTFGTTNLYSSRCNVSTNILFAKMLRFATRASRKGINVMNFHGYLHKPQTVHLGPVRIDVLWPPANSTSPWDATDENNNSLVLALNLDKVTFVLTGDCVADNWITAKADHVELPNATRMIQHPHHGARNGMFDSSGNTPWLDAIITQRKKKSDICVGLSCHLRPHGHPHPNVMAELDAKSVPVYRTDEHCHTTIRTDGTKVEIRYSRY